MKADHSSYFITTYKTAKQTCEYEKERKNKAKRKKRKIK